MNSCKKALRLIILALCLSIAFSMVAFAKPSNKTVKKAYKSYIKRYVNEVPKGAEAYYYIVDLNKDGVKECIVQFQDGMKCRLIILGYKSKKVVTILNTTGMESIHYNKKKNRICIDYSSGAVSHQTIIYKLSGKKLKKTDRYTSDLKAGTYEVIYYHKKKRLSENEFYSSLLKIWNSWTDVSPFTKGKRLS